MSLLDPITLLLDPLTSLLDPITPHLDQPTTLSLLLVVLLLASAIRLSLSVLPPLTPRAWHVLFIWHAFDTLIHLLLEGSFLYNCFFVSAPFDPATQHPAASTNFLNQPQRRFGSAHGDNWASALWMVYARADRRWGEADPTVVALELLTVLGAGPLAAWICYGIATRRLMTPFWMVVLATAELYGGFMTFAPEWLTGNRNLDGSNFMFLWVYLVFFNMLWVVMPLYALVISFLDVKNAFLMRRSMVAARVRMLAEQKEQ